MPNDHILLQRKSLTTYNKDALNSYHSYPLRFLSVEVLSEHMGLLVFS